MLGKHSCSRTVFLDRKDHTTTTVEQITTLIVAENGSFRDPVSAYLCADI